VRLQLEVDPNQTAKQLLEGLQERHPGSFTAGQLRTLQRRVREWRREHLYSEATVRDAFLANLLAVEPGAMTPPGLADDQSVEGVGSLET
jgi:hypothetical protein